MFDLNKGIFGTVLYCKSQPKIYLKHNLCNCTVTVTKNETTAAILIGFQNSKEIFGIDGTLI